jgi:hypothetical protein
VRSLSDWINSSIDPSGSGWSTGGSGKLYFHTGVGWVADEKPAIAKKQKHSALHPAIPEQRQLARAIAHGDRVEHAPADLQLNRASPRQRWQVPHAEQAA